MSAHTPGPWRIGGTEKRVIFADNGDVVARIACYGEQSETPEAEKANARLIAAAPGLLEALKVVTAHLASPPPGNQGWNAALNMAESAIAKAEAQS